MQAKTNLAPPAIYSQLARTYARYRPRYPLALFSYLALLCPQTALAWDAATGSGQAALGLAARFKKVVATDASAAQLEKAEPHPRVRYRQAPAEQSGLDARSVDLVTVAQAAHWFDLPAFYTEAHRVLRPEGVLAVWTYHLPSTTPRVDAVVRWYFYELLGPHLPRELAHVDSDYRTLPFPKVELEAQRFESTTRGTLFDMLGFLGSFGASVMFERAEGYNPVNAIRSELGLAWGSPERRLRWQWRFSVRSARWGPAFLSVNASP